MQVLANRGIQRSLKSAICILPVVLSAVKITRSASHHDGIPSIALTCTSCTVNLSALWQNTESLTLALLNVSYHYGNIGFCRRAQSIHLQSCSYPYSRDLRLLHPHQVLEWLLFAQGPTLSTPASGHWLVTPKRETSLISSHFSSSDSHLSYHDVPRSWRQG